MHMHKKELHVNQHHRHEETEITFLMHLIHTQDKWQLSIYQS